MGENIPKNSPEKEVPKSEKVFLNNFFLYLPGGDNRMTCEEVASNPKKYGEPDETLREKMRFMEAMDKLLKEEFPGIDPKEIFANMAKSSWLVRTTYHYKNMSEEEKQRRLEEAKVLSKDADNKLAPLFNRLVEMGFEKWLLMQ